MFANTFGTVLRLTSFGESHGERIGGILDGCPSEVILSLSKIQEAVDLRKSNSRQHGNVSTSRVELDIVEYHSGIEKIDEDRVITLGSPIAFSVVNNNVEKKAYTSDIFRPGHADSTYYRKYGIKGITGGGRASGRETVARVIGGAIANAILSEYGIEIYAGTESIYGVYGKKYIYERAKENAFYALDEESIPEWHRLIEMIREEGDTVGGTVCVKAEGVPSGLGEPVFDKIDARLSYAIMSIGAVKGIEIGAGFHASEKKGSENNDPIEEESSKNDAGGILGGITTGSPILLRVAVKPIPSIRKAQDAKRVDGSRTTIQIEGRHDICAIPRIVPVISSMVALTLADALLLHNARKRG